MAACVCDYKYKFTGQVDIGSYNGKSDRGIFTTSSDIHLALEKATLNLPKEITNLSGSNIKLSFFLEDSAFSLSSLS